MEHLDSIAIQRIRRLIEISAADWSLDGVAAIRCVEHFAVGDRILHTEISRNERTRRKSGGGRRIPTQQGSSCKELRRWSDYRATEARPGQGGVNGTSEKFSAPRVIE